MQHDLVLTFITSVKTTLTNTGDQDVNMFCRGCNLIPNRQGATCLEGQVEHKEESYVLDFFFFYDAIAVINKHKLVTIKCKLVTNEMY